jgi:hypothetical protein
VATIANLLADLATYLPLASLSSSLRILQELLEVPLQLTPRLNFQKGGISTDTADPGNRTEKQAEHTTALKDAKLATSYISLASFESSKDDLHISLASHSKQHHLRTPSFTSRHRPQVSHITARLEEPSKSTYVEVQQ